MAWFRSIFFAALFLGAVISAHDARGQDITGAMKFGGGVFTLAGDDDYKPLVNLAAVGSARFWFEPFLVQPELQISTRGAMVRRLVEPGGTEGSVRADQAITYLDVPVLVGLTAGGANAPAILVGPYAGVRIDSQVRLQFDGTGGQIEIRDVNRWDAGFIAAMSTEFDTRFYRVVVEARGLYGLTPVFSDGPSLRNVGAMLLVGISL